MSRFTKKAASAFLAVSTALWLTGAGSFVAVAGAQTTADLQAQIAVLLAQIAALQAQLNAQAGGGTSTAALCTFTRSLTTGSQGADVKCLQQYLNAAGFTVATSGAGSVGNETIYFGSLTTKAVAKWQAAFGVSPAVGYFGPISRAKYAQVAGTGTPGTGGQPPVVIPGANLQVGLGIGSPTGAAIAGAGQINVGRFTFTAPSATGVTINSLTFTKVGVLSDSNVNNLYLADANTGEVKAQFQSLSGSVATFSGLNINVPAGTTWTGELRMDLSSSATAGNTIAWQLSAVGATGATVTGLPVTANTLTVTSVSNPSIATLALTANAVGSTVDAGTNSVLVSSWTAAVTNSKVRLNSLQFTFVGSANPSDVRNLRLMVNGQQVATLAQASTETVFTVPGGIELNTGNSTLEVLADVAGSPNRTFTFSLLQPFKVNATDTQYNTGISPTITSTNQTTITINTGAITVQLASDSPTQPLPVGASGVKLAKFSIYAAGEPVKIQFIDVTINETGSSAWSTIGNVTDDVSNIALVDDVGGQVGSTITTVASGTSNGQCTLASTSITCHLGTSSSPINYTVPANTTRTFTLMVDIGSSADVSTLQGTLPGNSSNLQGQVSFQSASSGAASGAVRSVTSTPLSIGLNTAFSSPTYIAGAQHVKIASFAISAASAEGATISSMTFDKDSNANFDIQNLQVMIGSSQFGATKPTVGDAETAMAFSGSTAITAGQSITVDVYADILTSSATGTQTAVIDFTGWSALGGTSHSSISFPGAVSGQNVIISAGPTLTLASPSQPTGKQVAMETTGVELFKVLLTADNVSDITVTDITVKDTISNGSAGIASFQNFGLYDGSTKVAGQNSATMPGSATSTVTFHLSPTVTVPKNGSKTLTLKADVADTNGATSNSTHTFSIAATSDVTATAPAGATVTISGTPGGNTFTVYETKLSLSAMTQGSTTSRVRSSADTVAKLTFTADAAGQLTIGTLTLKFAGLAVSNGTTFNVRLLASDQTSAFGSSSNPQSCASGAGNSCTVTFSPQQILSAGQSVDAYVQVDSSSFYNAASNSESLSVTINSASNLLWTDGTTAGISLDAGTHAIPFSITTVSYE